MKMDRLAYLIKYRLPFLFPLVELAAQKVTKIRFGRLFAKVVDDARLIGTIAGKTAEVRALKPEDEGLLSDYLLRLDEEHLEYFRPHNFDVKSVRIVLTSGTYLAYGLFVDEKMIGYAFLKASPTGSLYRGRIISREYCGRGAGKFLGEYLTWQASLTGLRVRTTVSRANVASRKSFGEGVEVRVISELPNNYELLEIAQKDAKRPVLDI